MPDLRGELARHVNVRVRYLDRDGAEHDEVKRGLTAGTFQHEVDHLDGILFVDRADPRTLSTWEHFDRYAPRGLRAPRAPARAARRARDRLLVRARLARRRAGGAGRGDRGRWRSDRRRARGGARAARGRRATRRAHAARVRQRPLARLPPRAARAHPGGRGSFWTWRERMYELAARLDPESYFRLARATFAEMALAGITAVGEFHYLHHDPGGRPYDDPNEMGEAMIAAAARGRDPHHPARRLLPARRRRRAA